MGKTREFDTQDLMVKIVTRLPLHLQSRWRKEAYRTKIKFQKYPSFDELVSFLQTAAGEATDPLYGQLEPVSKFKGDENKSRHKKSSISLSVQAKDEKTEEHQPQSKSTPRAALSCRVCKKEHGLSVCPVFKAMDPKKRLYLVKENRLCFNCLDFANHGHRQCRRAGECQVNGCTLKHSKLLHDALKTDGGVRSQPRDEDIHKVQAKSCACGSVETNLGRVALPIVSVYVRGAGSGNFVKTKALLDPGSNRSFCSEKLLSQLNITGNKTKLSLETLSSVQETKATEVTLEVTAVSRRLKKRKVVKLPKVLAVKSIPSMKHSTVSPEEVIRWKQLRGLTVPEQR